MELVAIVEPSSGTNPGHMVIGQEAGGVSRYFGFRFDPTELPAEYQIAARWQEFLFLNTTFGSIHDEMLYLQRVREAGRLLVEKRVPCTALIEAFIPPPAEWHQNAMYSFSPDNFHSDASPCYNCVTWAIEIGNRVVAGFLTPVRQGRIKLIRRQLRFPDPAGAADDETH